MKNIILICIIAFIPQLTLCQKKVSITIDDVPNTKIYKSDLYQSRLLKKLDSLEIPIAIFINEGLIYKTDSEKKNAELLRQWLEKDYTIIGNHTFAHSKYSVVGLDSFKNDIIKGSIISKKLAKTYNKQVEYFRFPYNDLGKDSLEHAEINKFLNSQNYKVAPFTIESSDWMYNHVYEYFLSKADYAKADSIGLDYVDKTLEYFEFFEKLSVELYNRLISHIYLCHDNQINADYLDDICLRLTENNYEFVNITEALLDNVYHQQDFYFDKWGISWVYRWIPNHQSRIKYMRQEPSIEKLEALYDNLNK